MTYFAVSLGIIGATGLLKLMCLCVFSGTQTLHLLTYGTNIKHHTQVTTSIGIHIKANYY